jgi:hypothetical protein
MFLEFQVGMGSSVAGCGKGRVRRKKQPSAAKADFLTRRLMYGLKAVPFRATQLCPARVFRGPVVFREQTDEPYAAGNLRAALAGWLPGRSA